MVIKKPKILLIEDEITSAMNLQRLLRHWGYDCIQVSSGKEAIEKAIHEKPDIIVTDIDLNDEINGIEAARQIRSRFSIPTIFMTGYSDKDTMEEVKIAEPVRCFIKPLDFKKLRSTIDSVLRKNRKNLWQE